MDKPNRVETVQRACKIFISGMFFLLFPLITLAENASLAFGGKDVAADAPIEITSESLEVNQSDGTVVFSGDVLITQGALRLSAAKVLVSYDNDTSMIATINASDGVVLVSGAEAAEADGAEYDVLSRTVLMSGNVLLMQGNFALSAQQMRIDLEDGSAQMIGRVKTVLQSKSKS